MDRVLEGIRVLDFGRYIAGPYCATLLGDMGAEVIRVEKTSGSEDRWTTPIAEGGEGSLFMQVNRNKRGMTLEPRSDAGREVVRRLVERSDVVVANLPPQTLASMGLDYASLCGIRPDIILATVSAFGHGGPWSHRVGFDGVAQAMSGAMYLSGQPEGPPSRLYYPWVDFTTAILTAYGTLAALMERGRSGRGQQLEGALLMSAITVGNGTLIEQAVTGVDRVPTGNRGQTAAPSDCFQTRDGWVLVMAIGRPLFERWAKLMGEPQWLEDPRFESDQDRGDHAAVISERMARWCLERTTEECLKELDEARLPAGPVYTPQQALDHPHVQQMGFMAPVDYPGLPKPAPVATTPVRLSRTPGEVRHRAPVLGEHTEEVLVELGYSASEIAALRESGVI